ncbi:MAG: hypothetical protein HY815_12670, partial [Candidatus Riflebacteria bacterium]|nr:hypothetical protein [Candidatus Riflebacteria bacterium]
VLALLVAAGVRSTVGDALTGRWRDTPAIVAAIVAAAVAGKAAGGVLADRIGWRLSGVLALAMLAPLAPLALTSVPAAVAGTLLSQLTMAVTLAGVCAALPGRPGVAFGLTSLALLIGAIPALTHFFARHDAELYLQPMVLVALLAIFVGLGLVPRRQDTAAVPGATGPAPTRLWK